jgi:hypothetical protein
MRLRLWQKFRVDFCLKFGIIPASLPAGKLISPSLPRHYVWRAGQGFRSSRPKSNKLLKIVLNLSATSFGEMEAMTVCAEWKNLSAVALAKADQSKHINYAKRTQFSKKSNVYKSSINNGLQRKINNGHLVKTNPNEANL